MADLLYIAMHIIAKLMIRVLNPELIKYITFKSNFFFLTAKITIHMVPTLYTVLQP